MNMGHQKNIVAYNFHFTNSFSFVLHCLALYLICFEKVTTVSAIDNSDEWWKNLFIYEIFPRSFKDSDGNGVGDINGITQKLEYLAELGIGAIWLTPIFESPMSDFGYDISDYKAIDPTFGTMNDFRKLVATAKILNVKVILDFVPNHTSDKHPWFRKSIQRIKPYDDYYIWVDAKIVNGTKQPPNNWLSHFYGTAWSWNEQRQQYYYHVFTESQPDLNLRNKNVQNELEDVLRFWLEQGVDGFRVDAPVQYIEDEQLRDETERFNSDIPDNEYDFLYHYFAGISPESLSFLRSWKQILDDRRGPKKILLPEYNFEYDVFHKYTDVYLHGSDVPLNCIFTDILKTNKSSALDFKNFIENYLQFVPDGYQPNWVLNNHDRLRLATRYGKERADQISMLAAVLPGIVIVYQGDEIGMEDRPFTWEETKDPWGCNAGPQRYHISSRDPVRTPFQWDSSTSAGFSTTNDTWLPVHSNYVTLNLASQQRAPVSHYHVFKKLVALKKNQTIRKGTTHIDVVGNNVLGVVRRLKNRSPIVLLVNHNDFSVTVNLTSHTILPEKMVVYVASVASRIEVGVSVDTDRINLPSAASVILATD